MRKRMHARLFETGNVFMEWNGFMAVKTHNDNNGRTATTVEWFHGCENDAQRQQWTHSDNSGKGSWL
jgi:hypothetical protein